MKPNRLDNIFQVKGGIPILAGFYIGMDDDEVQERIDNLCSDQSDHSADDQNFSVSYEYELFEHEYLLKKILLVFPQECSKNDSIILINYFSEKFYHEKIHKEIETDSAGNLLKFKVNLSNYYFSCSFFNREGNFYIQLKGTVAYPMLYKAFYLLGTDSELKGFIHNSLSFGNNEASKDENLDRLFFVYNGFPTICGVYLGLNVSSSSDAEEMIDEILQAPDMYYQYWDYRDISFEVMVDENNQVDLIIMRISEENKDIALKIINHFKQRMLIENANYYVAEGTEGEFKIAVSMSNKYLSIKAESHYRPQINRRDIEISIETTKKDRSNLYQSLYAMLSDNTHYGYFKAADVFYHYDSANNYSPFGAYDSIEEAIEAFQGD